MFHFVLVVWYGLDNVPGLFEMCRDCLKTQNLKQSRHNRDLLKSTLFSKVHYVGYRDIKNLFWFISVNIFIIFHSCAPQNNQIHLCVQNIYFAKKSTSYVAAYWQKKYLLMKL